MKGNPHGIRNGNAGDLCVIASASLWRFDGVDPVRSREDKPRRSASATLPECLPAGRTRFTRYPGTCRYARQAPAGMMRAQPV